MKLKRALLASACLTSPILAQNATAGPTAPTSPPSENDPIPANQKCGLEYESVAGGRRSEQNYNGCFERPDYTTEFAHYDTHYQGSITVSWSGEPPCKSDTALGNGTFTLGQIQHPVQSNLTRAKFDNNPFWFQMKSYNSSLCNSAVKTCPPWIDATSSSPYYWWGQFWTLSSTKIENGYAISGNLSTKHINGASNGYYVKYIDCASADSASNDILTYKDQLSLVGTVTPEKVEVSFTVGKMFTDYSLAGGHPLTVQPTFKFVGTPRSGPDAKLSIKGPNIATEGSSIVDNTVRDQAAVSKVKTIIYATVGGLAGLIALCVIACCLCCLKRRSKRDVVYAQPAYVQSPPQYVQHGPYEPYSNGSQVAYPQR